MLNQNIVRISLLRYLSLRFLLCNMIFIDYNLPPSYPVLSEQEDTGKHNSAFQYYYTLLLTAQPILQ
jgi:hypothetical protein